MKREIIKRIISWVVTIAIFLLGGYAVKEYVEDRNNQQQQPETTVSYELNTEGFSNVVAYGDTIDLSSIKIVKTENGTTTEIPFDASMVTTSVDTTRVGSTMLKLSYAGQTFSVPVTVKYKIQFEVDGEVVETIHTLNSSDLANIEAPQKEGYTFVGWSSKIPDILFENMNLVARYEAIIPALSAVDAVYGDKLADITLPANAAGAWRFNDVNADSTVGDAGKKTFDVSFIENGTNAVLKTDKLSVTVAKRQVTIEVFADFTYNGTRQEPTYQTSVAGVKVYSWLDGDKNYTDAGEYTYHFEIDDVNYYGEAKGTYVIKKAAVTVQVIDATMLAHENIPKMEYQLSGFEGMSQEEMKALVGITLIYPDSVVVGEYKIGATASNPNVTLTVQEGTLTVNPVSIEGIGEPALTSKVATYGELISVIGFGTHPNGKWMWKNADAQVGTVGKQIHTAVFVPSNTAFDPIECEVEITVVPKQMVIEIVGDTTFDYDGSEHKVSFIVKDEEGNVRTDLVVLGNTPNVNAGRHEITLTLEDPNYSATKVVTLTINKINPPTDFTQIFNATWSATLKLSDIQLPAGYAWVNPDKRIEKAGVASYAVTFTPVDTVNYNKVEGEFTVDVAKATAKINNVEQSYAFIYNGSAFTLDRVTRPHEESKLEFVYIKDGQEVASMIDAGVYTVQIKLPESDNYLMAEATTTVTVSPATNTDNVNFSQSAIYGDLAQKVIRLPESTVGTWSIKGADETTTVGNFGANTFTLVFTPANGNYNAREEKITVNVAKKQINQPTLATDKYSQVYTGQTLTSGLQNGEGYIITDIGGINVGTYQVTISLANENYIWSDLTEEDKTISYSIIKAKNAWVVAPNVISWVYGQAGNAGTATAKGGEAVVEYKPYGADDSAYSSELPTKAGNYTARFTVIDSNYEDMVATFDFAVQKKAIELPTYTKEYTYTGNSIKADIPASDLYTVTDGGHTNVGSYAATVTLVDPENYEWAGDATTATQPLTYAITKANVELTNLQRPNSVYGTVVAPTVDMKFNVKVEYRYSNAADGEFTNVVPTNAGTYYVKAIFEGNQNFNAESTEPVEFVIEKAQASILGVREDKTYTTTYDATVLYNITGVSASNGATLSFTQNGEAFVGVTNAGTYTVTITLPGDENYKGDSVDVTIVINRAENKENVQLTYNATYQNLVANIITLPTGIEGTWSLKNVDETTTVGNAGANTFVAVYTCTTGNYNSREVTITVNVAPKKVTAPTVPADKQEQVYTGSTLTSGLQNGEGYVVVDEGGVYVGSYNVTVSLVSGNYVWSDGTTEGKTYTYKIIPSQNTEEIVTTYNAIYGNMLKDIVTLPTGVEGTWSIEGFDTLTVGNAGVNTFVAVFEPDEHGDYTRREVTITINVQKATVTAPTIALDKLSQTYTGNLLTSGLTVAEDSLYNIVDNGGTNAGTYYATLSLIDTANYKWNTTGNSNDIQLAYAITKAQITFTGDVAIEGWTYGQGANTPTVGTNFTCAITYVYANAIDGTYTATVPTTAGTHYVKAMAAGDNNLIAAESAPVAFTIAKAPVTIGGVEDSYSTVYNGNAFALPSVSASNGAKVTTVITKNGEIVTAIQGAGSYTVTYTVAEGINYLSATRTVTVTVAKADVIISDLAINGWTYGDAANAPSVKVTSSVTVIFKYYTDAACTNEIAAPTNAGTYYVKAFFAGNDNLNAAQTAEAVSFTIAKQVIQTPAVPNASVAYNATKQYSGIAQSALYNITNDGNTNKGTYDVTLTLVDPANYAWNDVENESETLTVQYTITEGTNAISNVSYTANWIYGQSVSNFSATAKYGTIAIKYVLSDETETTVRPTNAGTYTVVFSTTDENCPIVEATYTFTIAKADPVLSGAENTYTVTYNGEAFVIPTVVSTSGANVTYTIKLGGETVTEIIGVGEYIVTYSVEANQNYNAGTKSISVKVEQAEISFKDAPVIENWTFNTEANEPSVNVLQSFVDNDEVYFEFRYSNDGGQTWTEWIRWGISTFGLRSTMGLPTNAGTYELRARVEENVNYSNAATLESEIVTFVIEKADPTIDGVADGNLYTSIYNGNVYTVSGLSASYAGAPALVYTYTKNGATVGQIVGAGTYTVTVRLPESANYNAAEVEVTVIIEKADVTISGLTIGNWTYGQAAKNPGATVTFNAPVSYVYATAIDGEYTTTVPTNAGTYYVKAIFAGDDNLNATESEAVEFVINKATVQKPLVADKEYTGEKFTSGLTDTPEYEVTTDIGGIIHGTYEVVLTLKDPANYKWVNSDDVSITIEYEIAAAINTWVVEPSISSWEYGSAGNPGSAQAKYGAVKIEYLVNGNWVETLPTVPGSYMARFTSLDDNYTILKAEIAFTITPKEITAPTLGQTEFTYTGELITSGLVGNEFYTVVDNGATNVQTGITVTVTLNDQYYVWADNEKNEVRTYTYEITKADIIISDLAIEGWIYGDTANSPSANATFGATVTFKYYTDAACVNEIANPTDAGTYYVKAFAQGNENLNDAASDPVSFTIAKKAGNWITGVANGNRFEDKVYRGSIYQVTEIITALNKAHTESAAFSYVYTKDGVTVANIIDAGEYTVEIILADSKNYKQEGSVTVTVVIQTVENNDTIIVNNQYAVYGQLVSNLFTLPQNANGEWKIQGADDTTTVGNAGTNTYTFIFTSTNSNYADAEQTIEVTIDKQVVVTPAAPNASVVYDGKTNYSGLVETDLYEVTTDGAIAVGKHNAVLTLKDADNYAWDRKDNGSATTTVEYAITMASVSITVPTINGWTYGDNANTPSFTVSKDFVGDVTVIVEYSQNGQSWNETVPNKAGNYKVRVRIDGTANYNGYTTSGVDFAISKKEVTVPTYTATYTYTGSEITVDIDPSDLYTVSGDKQTVVNNYQATLSLTDKANYKWSNTGASDDIQLAYAIEKASVTISDLAIEGWTYGDNANEPTFNVDYDFAGDVARVVEYSEHGDAWSTTPPANAGTYYVRVRVDDNANYNGYTTTEVVSFTIAKASVTIGGIEDNYSTVYNGNAFTLPSITVSNGATATMVITKDGANVDAIVGAGTYIVTYTVAESGNYLPATRTVKVTVAKADVTISDLAIGGWIYGQTANNPSATANFGMAASLTYRYYSDAECANEISKPTNAGTYYVKAIFAGNDNLNAAESDATEFVIARAVATAPTASNKPYNKAEQTSGLTNGTGYVVKEDNGGKNVGDYTVTVALDGNNYIWSDGTTADKVLSYKITPIDNEQSIVTQYNAVYGNLISNIVTLPTNEEGTWSIEGDPTTVGNFGPNTFKAVFTPDANGNYNSRSETITINVAKANPTIDGVADGNLYTSIYNGNVYTISGLSASYADAPAFVYTYTKGNAIVSEIKDAGTYTVTVRLPESDNYNAVEIEVTVTVAKASVTISNLAIKGWTYGQYDEIVNKPTFSVDYDFEGDVPVIIEYSTDGEAWSKTPPANAGTYYVRVKVIEDDNYTGDEKEVSFTIKQVIVNVPGVSNKPYNGSVQTSGLVAGTGYTVVDNGGTNVGTYNAVVSLVSNNYVWADGTSGAKTLTYEITAIENTQSITTTYNATYGQLLKDIVILPVGVEGKWSIKNVTENETVGNAGINSFTAVFTPDANGNYVGREVEITINVAKKIVNVPTYTATYTYTGSEITAGIPTSDLYTVSGDKQTVVGNYQATLTLTDAANYKWNTTGESDPIELAYEIQKANVTVSSFTIAGWTFGQTAKTPSVNANFTVTWTYKYATAIDGEYTNAIPTNAGTYYVKAFFAGDNNLNESESAPVAFTIAKAEVEVPDYTDKYTYTGGEITVDIPTSTLYNIAGHKQTAADTYTATLTLVDTANYKWKDTDAATVTLEYEIVKGTISLETPVVNGAVYGQTLNPTVTVKLNGVVANDITASFKFYSDANCQNEVTPVNCGITYYVKATVAGTQNYNEASVSTSFTLAKANATFNKDNSYSVDVYYTGEEFVVEDVLAEITATYNGEDLKQYLTYRVTKDGLEWTLEDTGEYKVTVTLNNSNYNATSIEVTINIKPALNTDEVNQNQNATYGDSINKIVLPTGNQNGQWSIKENVTTVGNAGTNKFTALFTPYDPTKHASREVEITVNVAKATVNTPVIADANKSQTYTSETLYSGLTDGTLYKVSDDGGVNVGTYYATLTLKDKVNYQWSTTGNSDDVKLEYKITKATVGFNAHPSIIGWTYGQTANKPSGAVVDKAFATVQYEYLVGDQWVTTVPTDAGNYSLRARVVETNNYNEAISNESSFSIAKATITIEGEQTEYTATYTGNAYVIPGIRASQDAEIIYTYTKNGVAVDSIIDAGVYSVTITIPDTDNYFGESETVKVTIEQATIQIDSFSVGTWIYGNEMPFSIVIKVVGEIDPIADDVARTMVTFKYYSDAECTNEIAAPTNAGDTIYYVKAIVEETANYKAATSVAKDFRIGRATPVWDDIFTGKTFYQNMLSVEVAKLVAKNGNTVVEGTFEFTSTFSATAGQSNIKVTFTPKDQNNYVGADVSAKTYNITLATVAYLNNSTPYGSIETALDDAVYGDTVWVRPNSIVGLGDIYIMDDIIIRDGVTLLLPYGTTNDIAGRNQWIGDLMYYELMGGQEAPADIAENSAALCIVKVVLAANKTITIRAGGVLEISGQLSGGGGGHPYSGYTKGKHAQLLLSTNATINNYGTIYAAGFIREVGNPAQSNGSKVIIQNGGKVEQPFVVCDFAGGTGTSAMYFGAIEKGIKATPFNRFVMMNVGSTLQVNYGGALRAWAALAANDVNNVTSVTFIGVSGSGAVIELTDAANSYLTARYNPLTQICDLHVFGGAKTNAMVLNLEDMDLSVSTAQFFFPISHFYHITLEPNRDNGQAIATFTMAQEFKLMPGAELTVEAGAVLNIGGLIVYQDYVDTKTIGGALGGDQAICQYPTTYINGTTIPWAKLTVNGTMICGSFGGEIHSTGNGAFVQITGATTYTAPEVQKTTSVTGCTTRNITLNAVLLGTNNTTPSVSNMYIYENGEWKTGVTINLNSNGGDTNGLMGLPVDGGVYQNLPKPSREHYIFDGWYNGNTKVENGDSLPTGCANTTITLTARWTPIEYTIKYEGVDMDTGNSINVGIADSKFTAESILNWPEFTTPTGYYDAGWMFNGKTVSELLLKDCLTVAKASADGTIVVYVRFTKDPYTYKFDMGSVYGDISYGDVLSGLGYDPTENDALMDLVTKYDTNPQKQYYFGGWYTDPDFQNAYTTVYAGDGATKEITLYAKWIEKVSITYQPSGSSKIYDGDAVSYGTYWYIPGTNNITLPVVTKNDGATTNANLKYYFVSWTIQVGNGAATKFDKVGGSPYSLTENSVITITWGEKVAVTIKLSAFENISLGGVKATDGQKVYLVPNSETPYAGIAQLADSMIGNYKIKNPSSKITGAITGISIEGNSKLSFNYYASATDTLTVEASWSCFVEGTLITLADGTQKKVEDLTGNEQLLVWNHYTGRFDVVNVLSVIDHNGKVGNTLSTKLMFSDGGFIEIIGDHVFYDVDLGRYVSINSGNVEEYVGHTFLAHSDDASELKKIQLVGYTIEQYIGIVYQVYSQDHYVCFTNGILSTGMYFDRFMNAFEFDNDTFTYDEAQMQADIEKYGLYTYEDFEGYLPEEAFDAYNFKVLKISVAKGLITWEEILEICKEFNNAGVEIN